jgi:hypothetical protein
MLQTEAYLYDRKLRSQTFIVQTTDRSCDNDFKKCVSSFLKHGAWREFEMNK